LYLFQPRRRGRKGRRVGRQEKRARRRSNV
jgi:hypothetical protein